MRGSSSDRQLPEHVGHLVPALAAADVDDHVGVAPLGDLLQEHGLAGAEAAGHGRRSCPRATGKKRSSARWPVTRGATSPARRGPGTAAARRTGQRCASPSSRPPTRAITSSIRVGPRGRRPSRPGRRRPAGRARGASSARASGTLPRSAPGRTSAPAATRGVKSNRRSRGSVASAPAGREELLGIGQAPEHAVEDAAEQPGTELGSEREAARDDLLAGPQPAGVLVDLHGGHAVDERDHLAREVRGARPRRGRAWPRLPAPRPRRRGRRPGRRSTAHRHSSSTAGPSDPMQRSTRAGSVRSTLRLPSRAANAADAGRVEIELELGAVSQRAARVGLEPREDAAVRRPVVPQGEHGGERAAPELVVDGRPAPRGRGARASARASASARADWSSPAASPSRPRGLEELLRVGQRALGLRGRRFGPRPRAARGPPPRRPRGASPAAAPRSRRQHHPDEPARVGEPGARGAACGRRREDQQAGVALEPPLGRAARQVASAAGSTCDAGQPVAVHELPLPDGDDPAHVLPIRMIAITRP